SCVVRTTTGSELVAEVLVAGLGITPAVELAEQAGLPVDNGILVDEFCRTSQPDVYAAGDVANFANPALGTRLRVEHEDNANTMGRTAGFNMAGRATRYDHLPFFYSDLFDLGYEAVGELDARLETVADWKEPFREGVVGRGGLDRDGERRAARHGPGRDAREEGEAVSRPGGRSGLPGGRGGGRRSAPRHGRDRDQRQGIRPPRRGGPHRLDGALRQPRSVRPQRVLRERLEPVRPGAVRAGGDPGSAVRAPRAGARVLQHPPAHGGLRAGDERPPVHAAGQVV